MPFKGNAKRKLNYLIRAMTAGVRCCIVVAAILSIGQKCCYGFRNYLLSDDFYLPLTITEKFVSIYGYYLEKYTDNILKPRKVGEREVNGFSIIGFPKNITGNEGGKFTFETKEDLFLPLHVNLGLIGLGYGWKIDDGLDFIASSDLFMKIIEIGPGVIDKEFIEIIRPVYDLTSRGYFSYSAKNGILCNLGLAITHKFARNVPSSMKNSMTSSWFFRNPSDDYGYENYDYDSAKLIIDDLRFFYYDSRINLNVANVFFTAYRDYKFEELFSAKPKSFLTGIELKNLATVTVYSISDLEVKMINIFNLHPDHVKDFDIPKNYLFWLPKNRISAILYKDFTIDKNPKNYLRISAGPKFDIGKTVYYKPPYQLKEEFTSSLGGVLTVGISYQTILAEFSIENKRNWETWRINFSLDFEL
ncbi:MAG: hypothetical protein LBB13_02810 [Rickettsiales bacterium]|jgi:hypothetical protein|nr:hypothetical protein [Rickettsiales bacterium]